MSSIRGCLLARYQDLMRPDTLKPRRRPGGRPGGASGHRLLCPDVAVLRCEVVALPVPDFEPSAGVAEEVLEPSPPAEAASDGVGA
jgi:hypothetical protein